MNYSLRRTGVSCEQMSEMMMGQQINVHKFILFNTDWGRVEGHESEKIIYSSTSVGLGDDKTSQDHDLEANDDLKQVSLCEASIAFINLFKVNDEDMPVSMEGYGGTMLVFRKVERPSFWLLAVISSDIISDATVGSEYYSVYQLLGSLYTSFARQSGSLKNSSAGGETSPAVRARLTKKCRLFFEWFLPHTESGSSLPATLLPIPTPANVFGGQEEGLMKYLSLDSQSFMSVRSFVHHIIYSYSIDPQMGVMFMYNDSLVTSTIPLRTTRFLYSYITSHVIPEAVCDEMSWDKKRTLLQTYWLFDRKPIILYLPNEDDGCEENEMLDLEWTKRDIYIYRSLNGSSLVVLFNSLDSLPNRDNDSVKERRGLLESIDLYSKQHLYNLTAIVSKASVIALKTSSLPTSASPDRLLVFHNPSASASSPTSPSTDSDSGLSFLYYNEANSALKTFSPASCFRRQSSGNILSSPATSLSTSCSDPGPLSHWNELEADLRTIILRFRAPCSRISSPEESPNRRIRRKTAEGGTELLAKTDLDDNWVCLRRIDQRSLFATLSCHKNLNLEEVAAMCNQKYSPNSRTSSHLLPFTSLFL